MTNHGCMEGRGPCLPIHGRGPSPAPLCLQILLEAKFAGDGQIAITQPRRVVSRQGETPWHPSWWVGICCLSPPLDLPIRAAATARNLCIGGRRKCCVNVLCECPHTAGRSDSRQACGGGAELRAWHGGWLCRKVWEGCEC